MTVSPPDKVMELVTHTGSRPDEALSGYFQIANPAGCAHWSPPGNASGGRPRRGAKATCQTCTRAGRSLHESTGIIDGICP